MGHYTQLVLDVQLSAAMPSEMVNELLAMTIGEGTGEGRRRFMLRGGSAAFDDWFELPTFTKGPAAYRLRCNCSIKNYCREIEWFLGWIAPWVLGPTHDSGAGYVNFEGAADSTPIFFRGGNVSSIQADLHVFQSVDVEEIELALANAAKSPLEEPF